jgi:hypothetical protein
VYHEMLSTSWDSSQYINVGYVYFLNQRSWYVECPFDIKCFGWWIFVVNIRSLYLADVQYTYTLVYLYFVIYGD